MVAPKREKMACQRSMTQKKGERKKKGVSMSQKKERDIGMIRERKAITSRSKSYPSIHPSIHPLIHLHLLIEIAWLVSPWILSLTLQYMECKYALFLPFLSSTKDLYRVGKTEARYWPGEDIKVECFERIILGTLPYFRKFIKNISRWIAELWTSKYYFVHHSNSQQPKTRRKLRSPMKE